MSLKYSDLIKNKNIDATIMFVDVRGFTKMTMDIGAIKSCFQIKIFYKVVRDSVEKYQGTIDNYLGDGVFIHFGIKPSVKDHQDRAMMCALDIQGRMRRENRLFNDDGGHPMLIGTGLASGDVVLDWIDHHERMLCIGTPVNIAAKLASKAGAGKILMCKYTRETLSNHFVTRPHDPIMPSGFDTGLHVFEF